MVCVCGAAVAVRGVGAGRKTEVCVLLLLLCVCGASAGRKAEVCVVLLLKKEEEY